MLDGWRNDRICLSYCSLKVRLCLFWCIIIKTIIHLVDTNEGLLYMCIFSISPAINSNSCEAPQLSLPPYLVRNSDKQTANNGEAGNVFLSQIQVTPGPASSCYLHCEYLYNCVSHHDGVSNPFISTYQIKVPLHHDKFQHFV